MYIFNKIKFNRSYFIMNWAGECYLELQCRNFSFHYLGAFKNSHMLIKNQYYYLLNKK